VPDEDEEETTGLNWYEERDGYYIAWEFDDGPGMYLGETGEPDHEAASAAAATIGGPSKTSFGALRWESESLVKKALKAAKAALEVFQSGIPLPDWALKAQSEGWKPPMGWKPKLNDDLLDGVSEQMRLVELKGGAAGWEAAAVLAASGAPSEALADMCQKNADELKKQATK
jgi:hypothetical protein